MFLFILKNSERTGNKFWFPHLSKKLLFDEQCYPGTIKNMKYVYKPLKF